MTQGPKSIDWFCGIGGFRLAMDRTGLNCVASCELATFPRNVYAARFGAAPTWKDMTHVEAKEIPEADIWVGGFPCQDVSAAGRGLGLLGGKRSGLVFRFLGLAAVARPQWILLENTPGLLFRGRGYGRLLAVLARLGYGFAWRRLDAQYFGVAQRRKRIFVLACLGARAGMRRAAEILLEPESVRRDPPTRQEAGQRVASTLTRSLGARGTPRGAPDGENLVVSSPVTSKWAKGTGGPAGDECQNLERQNLVVQRANLAWLEGVADPLVAGENGTYTHEGFDSNGAYGDAAGGTVVIPFNAAQVTHPENRSKCEPGDPAYSLAKSGEPMSVACAKGRFVRRLTPKECERLQGFPDDWTLIDKASDAARYRALGNAVAVPVVEWIAKRLIDHLSDR